MEDFLDFCITIVIVTGYVSPFIIIGWIIESWWMRLPRYKRHNIIRRIGGAK